MEHQYCTFVGHRTLPYDQGDQTVGQQLSHPFQQYHRLQCSPPSYLRPRCTALPFIPSTHSSASFIAFYTRGSILASRSVLKTCFLMTVSNNPTPMPCSDNHVIRWVKHGTRAWRRFVFDGTMLPPQRCRLDQRYGLHF